MKNLKKVVAILSVTTMLTTSAVSVASAGAVVDFFKSAASTVVNAAKTVGNSVVGAGKYVFTDADYKESFGDAEKSAQATVDNLKKTGNNVLKVGQDIQNFQMGMIEMVGGTVATAATAVAETAVNVVTGSDNYNWTKTTAGVIKDGYDRYDSAYDTACDIASMAGPLGAAAANGMKVVKTAGEAAVGYKNRTWEDVGKAAKDAAVNTVISAVSGGMGTQVGTVVSETAGAVTTAVTKTVMNTAKDLVDPNNTRSVADTIAENVVGGAMTTGTVNAVK